MTAPLFGPDWIKKDQEWHSEKYAKFLSAVENASNSSDEGIKQVIMTFFPMLRLFFGFDSDAFVRGSVFDWPE